MMLTPIKIKIINKTKDFQTTKIAPLRIHLFDLNVEYSYIRDIVAIFNAKARSFIKVFVSTNNPAKESVFVNSFTTSFLQLFGKPKATLTFKDRASGKLLCYGAFAENHQFKTTVEAITHIVSAGASKVVFKSMADAIVVGVRHLQSWCGIDNQQTMGVTFGDTETLNTLCYINQ